MANFQKVRKIGERKHVADLLEGVLSYNPPVRKSAFLAFDHFF